jgi:hypothetical protein
MLFEIEENVHVIYFFSVLIFLNSDVMKKFYLKLSVVLITVFSTQQNIAQNNYGYPVNNGYNEYNNSRYDLSDHLDLEAVASVFAKSRNITDFEHRLNDYRNQVSNLDLNNDGYVDYLRLVKLYDRGAHVILIQAILGQDYFQDVATVVIGRDTYNREYIQFIGDPYLYGQDYILEPAFYKRPYIVRWLWSNSGRVYVSRYNWGYYPGYYRLRSLLSIPLYFNHIHLFVDVHHRYHYTNHWRHSMSFDRLDHYRRNDYWRRHNDKRFDQRNHDIKNKGYFQHNQFKKEADIRERNYKDVRPSESDRRGTGSGVAPQRDTRSTQPKVIVPGRDSRSTTPSKENRITVPSRNNERESKTVTPQRDTRVTAPSRESRVTTPSKDTRVVPQRESRVTVQKESKVTSSKESKVVPKRESVEVKRAKTKDADDRKSSSGRR